LSVSSFGEDEAGEVYVVNHLGSIHRIRVVNPQPASARSMLIPSSARSDRFTSSLILVNGGPASEQVTVTQRGVDGAVGATMNSTLGPGGVFQTDDVLGALGLPLALLGLLPSIPRADFHSRCVGSSEHEMDGGFMAAAAVTEASVER
jgi:hypothetical protein